jgi:hypothetical protein
MFLPTDAYHDHDFEDPPASEPAPVTAPSEAPPDPEPFAFVRIAIVNGRLAIVERGTAEPIQFVSAAGRSGVELTAWAEKLAAQWNEHFLNSFERNRLGIGRSER